MLQWQLILHKRVFIMSIKIFSEVPMIHLENLDRQHVTILAEVNFIETEAKKDSSQINAAEAALHISRLSGLLKMHLLEEDKYFYPELLASEDHKVQSLAKLYIDEMGDLANAYTEYKSNYNVASKINKNLDSFVNDTKKIVAALEKRISNEDKELYRLVREINL